MLSDFFKYTPKKMQQYKKRIKAVGVRSIYDIIHSEDLTFSEKVSYIRHKYVYYDGITDMFYDQKRRPLKSRELLDEIIEKVINGETEVSTLTELNAQLLALHKKQKLENKQREQEELELFSNTLSSVSKNNVKPKQENQISTSSVYTGIPTWKKALIAGTGEYKTGVDVYVNLIEKYLASLSKEEFDAENDLSYKALKKRAVSWAKMQGLYLEPISKSALKLQQSSLIEGYKKHWAAIEKEVNQND